MQVLFHKHVWLYSEYIPTLHWWTRASSVSPCVITVAWGITSDIIIHHWSIAYELFKYCSSLIYCSVAIVTITTKPKNITFATVTFIIILLLLLNTLLQILSYPGVVELTNQLLILNNILWLLRESWIRGCPDSRTITIGRTPGLWRYKIKDFVPCPDGTFIGVEGKLGDTDM